MKIIEPGFYKELSNEDYHSSFGISRSGIMEIRKSPLHYYNNYLSENKEKKENNAMFLGTAFHSLILEPRVFKNKYIYNFLKCDRRTKEGQALHLELQNSAEEKGMTVLNSDISSSLLKMSGVFNTNKKAIDLLFGCDNETSIYFNEETTGELCKCRPDAINLEAKYVIDIKTTRDASPDFFRREIKERGYHIQAAMIKEGVHSQLGVDIESFIFICIENSEPHYMSIYILDDSSLQKGMEEFKETIAVYSNCLKENSWNGYEIRTIKI